MQNLYINGKLIHFIPQNVCINRIEWSCQVSTIVLTNLNFKVHLFDIPCIRFILDLYMQYVSFRFTFLVWGFGLAAVSVVSLISLLMIIPLLRTKFYRKSIVFLIALTIGTLVGDSVFHLLPRVSLTHLAILLIHQWAIRNMENKVAFFHAKSAWVTKCDFTSFRML